jgi:hypothetical protein
MRRGNVVRLLVCAVLAGGSLVGSSTASQAATSTSRVPFRMDASNQAGWWKPIEEFGGRIYVAYNAWGGPTAGGASDTHTVYVAKRETDGGWTRGCMKAPSGQCAIYGDDVGHNQPTIAIDGHGHIHAFVSMHGHNWRYYRSSVAGDVTSMVDRSAEMPDQGGIYTYPSATRSQNGDVYLIIRAHTQGRLYRWNNASNAWSRVATFAAGSGFVVYPDEISGDSAGDLHITWEWAYGGANGLRHLGSYLRYSPASNRFHTASGAAVAVPATTASPVVYQPLEGQERATDRDSAARPPGVQSAKVAVNSARRPVVAYRYRPTAGGRFHVRLAEWTGSAWRRQTVYAGRYETYAAVDVTSFGTGLRVYYAKNHTIGDDQATVADRRPAGWTESLVLAGVPVERLAVIRRGAVDHLYLASPSTAALYYGANTW